MIYRKLGNDENIIRIGQKYFTVNDFTLKLILAYNQHEDLKSLSCELGFLEDDTQKLYDELNFALKNSGYTEEDIELKTPLKVQWRLTDLCNLQCKHCYLGTKSNMELSSDKLIEIADKIIAANVMEVTITGGEPLLVQVLPEIIKKFLNANMLINIFTNAIFIESLLSKLEKVANKENLRFNISIDGLKETHESIRGIGTYEKLIDSIKFLVKEGFFVTTNTTLTAINFTDIPRLILEMKRLGVKTFQISNLVNLGWATENNYLKMDKEKTLLFETQIAELTNVCKDGFRFLYSPLPNEEISDNPTVFKFEEGVKEKIGTDMWRCGAGKGKVTISVNGDVLCCPFFNKYIIGNIMEDSLENIWMNPQRKEFVKYLNKVNGRKRICAALKGAYNVC